MSDLAQNISLQPWPKTSAVDGEILRTTLDRIYAQKGHFRHITEESLEKELQNETGDDTKSDASEEQSVEEAAKGEVDAFNKAKLEMIKQVSIAHNAAYQALDFVSLLLSKDAPQRANISLSPFMKQKVPPGILTYDIWPSAAPSPAQQEAQMTAARGWRMKSLSSSANKLSEAAARLEKDLKKETNYWEQVLSVTEKGWSVRKVDPERNRHTLGVQFGSLEAGPQFRGRGFAALETDEDGSVILNRHLTRTPKALRIRIVSNLKLLGASQIPTITRKEASVETLIHRARDSLFDEELYHELILETRQLQAYGVRAQDGVIRIPLQVSNSAAKGTHATEIIIELLPLEDSSLSEKRDMDSFAEYVAASLRILLSHNYRARQQKRTQIPPPLSDEPRKPPPSVILRPLLNHLRHYAVMTDLRSYLSHTSSALRAAGLPITVEVSHETMTVELSKISQGEGDLELPLSKLVTSLSSPIAASISISLPSSSGNLVKADIKTHFAPPEFGTAYTLHLESPIVALLFSSPTTEEAPDPRTQNLASLAELTEFIDDILELDILHNIVVKEHPEWKAARGELIVSKNVNGRRVTINLKVRGGKVAMLSAEKDVKQAWSGSETGISFRDLIAKVVRE